MKTKSNPFLRRSLVLAASSAFLSTRRFVALAALVPLSILGIASQTNAAALLPPGAVQVEYTFGEGGTTWAANFQNDASGNGRTMASGGGDAPWGGGAYAPGSTNSIMVLGPAAYVMDNTAGIASDFQVSIFLSSNGQFYSGNAGGATVFNIGDLRLEATGVPSSESMTYSASVGANLIGSITVDGWANAGLLVQKVGSTFSFWASNDTGASWTQQGSDLVDVTANINWSGTHLFIKPGGGSQYNGYADDFKVTAAVSDPFANWMATNFPAIVSPDNAPGADPENDGIANLLEYVLQGGDPSVSTTGTLPTLDASGLNFVFTYYRRAAATGTTQVFQYSPDLGGTPWTNLAIPGGAGVVVTADTPSSGIDQVVITVAKGANTKLFGRLQVVK